MTDTNGVGTMMLTDGTFLLVEPVERDTRVFRRTLDGTYEWAWLINVAHFGARTPFWEWEGGKHLPDTMTVD